MTATARSTTAAVPITWPGGPRWALADQATGAFCRDDSHAPTDYRAPDVPKGHVGRVCGRCLPVERYRTAAERKALQNAR